MGLTGALLRAAAARPRVLPVVAPGATAVRLAAERELRQRSWPVAAAPADAAVLLVCGRPGPELAAAVERVWTQLPLPKARAQAPDPAALPGALDGARAAVADLAGQRAAARAPVPEPPELPMAGRGPDRDGLALDQLHVALGPILPDWPAGLVLHLVLQGDVIQQARPEVVAGAGRPDPPFWAEPWRRAAAGEPVTCGEAARRLTARHLDSAGRMLAVAGWPGAAVGARRLRDDALAGVAAGQLAGRVRRLRRRVAGSLLLRWMTAELGRLDRAAVAASGTAPPPESRHLDASDRIRWWLDRAGQAAARFTDPSPLAGRLGTGDLLAAPPPAGSGSGELAELARLVEGTELAAARLVVASLDPDLDPDSDLDPDLDPARRPGDG